MTDNKSWMFNYDDIFFCYHTEDGIVFDKTIDFHSLIYIHTGELLVNDGKRNRSVRSGQCVFLRRNHRVNITKRPDSDGVPFRGIFFIFRKPMLLRFYKEHGCHEIEKRQIAPLPDVMMLDNEPSIKSLFVSMIPYFDANITPSEQMMSLKLHEGLLATLQTDERFYPCLFDFHKPWKIDIAEFIEKNYMYNLTLEELARFTGRSVAAFKRDFKTISDLSPQRWIMQKRLDKAHRMIAEQGKRASDVYLKLGFKSLSHFSTAFRHRFGYSPTKISE